MDVVYDYTVQNLNKMSLITDQLEHHYDVINDSVKHLELINEQLDKFGTLTKDSS